MSRSGAMDVDRDRPSAGDQEVRANGFEKERGGYVREFEFGVDRTGDGRPCFVIAEIGHNHQGNVELAKEMIKAARDSGVSGVKLQKRDVATLMTADFASSAYRSEHAFGETYGAHRAALELDADAWRTMFDYAAEIGITIFATAFDCPSVDFLEELKSPVVKISSGDALNWPLLDYVAARGLPMIISTGGLDWAQLDATVDRMKRRSAQFALLQCTSSYPCRDEELELRVITEMRARYPDVVIGYSGHEDGIAPTLAAVALGARIVERHFTTDKSLKGSDHRYSLDGAEMTQLTKGIRTIEAALGAGVKQRFASEESALLKLGKKLVAARELEVGQVIGERDLETRSPGDGVAPYRLEEVLGRTVTRQIPAGGDITWECLR